MLHVVLFIKKFLFSRQLYTSNQSMQPRKACSTFPSLERGGPSAPGGWWKVESCMSAYRKAGYCTPYVCLLPKTMYNPMRISGQAEIFSCEKDKNPKAYKRKGVQTQLLSGRTQQNFTGNTCSPALEQTRLINSSTTNFRVQILAGPGVARQLLQIMSVGSSMPPPFNLVLQACRLILAYLHLICMHADELYIVSYNSICEWGYMH